MKANGVTLDMHDVEHLLSNFKVTKTMNKILSQLFVCKNRIKL